MTTEQLDVLTVAGHLRLDGLEQQRLGDVPCSEQQRLGDVPCSEQQRLGDVPCSGRVV